MGVAVETESTDVRRGGAGRVWVMCAQTHQTGNTIATEDAERQDGVYSRGRVQIGRGNMWRVHPGSSEYADKRAQTRLTDRQHRQKASIGHLRQKTVTDMVNRQK